MYDKLEIKSLVLEQGDILFETKMIAHNFDELVNTCIVSTAFMFNIYNYNNENIYETCEAYIEHYLSQKHQKICLAETETDGLTEYRILDESYHVLVLSTDGTMIDTVKFSKSGNYRATTWNVNNDYWKSSRYFQLRYIKKMYPLDELKEIWSNWVRKNFQKIIDGELGRSTNLLF